MRLILLYLLLLTATSVSMQASDRVAAGDYYLMHSSGCHVEKSADGRAVLAAGDVKDPMTVTITPVDEEYYTLSTPDGEHFLSLEGRYNTYFLPDADTDNARFAIVSEEKNFIMFRCKANNRFLGTDKNEPGAHIYADKQGSDFRNLWYLSNDPTAEPPLDLISYEIDPMSRRQTFEGWGVSLCWWANMCGRWTDEKIDEIIDWLVSPEGLNFSLFRYNIGGGDDPEFTNCTPHHNAGGKGIRAEMEGFKDSPDGPYIWTRDEAQRKIMLKIREKRPDAVFEAFSNSCPYYMTYSGCAAGNVDSGKDNLRKECYEDFARYLVDVCRHYKDEYGIEFRTLDPFNEPMTNYWGASGGQEGCHFDVESQIEFLKVLYPILKESGLSTVISAADETSVAQSVNDFLAYKDAGILDLIGQFNTHTYSADDISRARLSHLCSENNIPLWMSEVGSGGNGIEGNLNVALKLIADIRYIMPSAWIDWQYIEENNDQWCMVKAESFESQKYARVKNYYVRSHFSRFIGKDYTFLSTSAPATLAAVSKDRRRLVLVTVNNRSVKYRHSADLSLFGKNVTVSEAYVTDADRNMDTDPEFILDASTLRYTLQPHSIVTFVLDIPAVSGDGMIVEEGERYLVSPRTSCSKFLTGINGSVIIDEPSDSNSMIWMVENVGEEGIRIMNGNGDYLSYSSGYNVTLVRKPSEAGIFKLKTADGIFHSIRDKEGVRCLDLKSASTSAGTEVGMWNYDDASIPTHRQWLFCRTFLDNNGLNGIDMTDREIAPRSLRVATEGNGMVRIEAADGTKGSINLYSLQGKRIMCRPLSGDTIIFSVTPGYYILQHVDGDFRRGYTLMVR